MDRSHEPASSVTQSPNQLLQGMIQTLKRHVLESRPFESSLKKLKVGGSISAHLFSDSRKQELPRKNRMTISSNFMRTPGIENQVGPPVFKRTQGIKMDPTSTPTNPQKPLPGPSSARSWQISHISLTVAYPGNLWAWVTWPDSLSSQDHEQPAGCSR